MKTKLNLLMIAFTMLLTACGSGGDGGSASATSNGGGTGGGGNGGGNSGGNGNAAYYGVSTGSATPLTNQVSPPTGGSLMSITGEVAVNVRNLNNRAMDM